MSVASDRVILAFQKLSPAERTEALTAMGQFINAPDYTKRSLTEAFETKVRSTLGPKDSSSCPMCGR